MVEAFPGPAEERETSSDEEEGITPPPTRSIALNVDVGKRDSIDTSYSSLDFIPEEEEEGEEEHSQNDGVENTSEGSSEDSKDYFCGETLDRPSLQHHGKDDPLDLSGGKARNNYEKRIESTGLILAAWCAG